MRKLLVSLLLVSFLATISSAQVFIGSKQAGMGGTGVASAVGLNAVAYNPAGLMKGPGSELLLSVGIVNQGLDQIANSLSKATDPAQFMVDNYGNLLDANGNLYGIIGLSLNRVGVSVLIPSVMANINKPADSLGGSVTAMGEGGVVLTVGHTFGVPFLPASLDVGANLKSLTIARGNVSITNPDLANPNQTATQEVVQASAVGYDLGARTTFEIPFLADFSVGVAMRNLGQTFKYKPTTRTDSYVYNPSGDPTFTPGTDQEGAETEATSPTTTAIGASGSIPAIGLKVAADVSSVTGGTGILATTDTTVTSLGLEYPVMGFLILRGGTASGTGVSYTTIGAKLNIPFLTLELASITDNNNSKNNSFVVDAGLAL